MLNALFGVFCKLEAVRARSGTGESQVVMGTQAYRIAEAHQPLLKRWPVVEVLAPVSEAAVPLGGVPHEVFAERMAGEGRIIVPDASGEALAPVPILRIGDRLRA